MVLAIASLVGCALGAWSSDALGRRPSIIAASIFTIGLGYCTRVRTRRQTPQRSCSSASSWLLRSTYRPPCCSASTRPNCSRPKSGCAKAVQRRLDEHPEKMRQRRETVEHPFGTIKARMGATHFLMKTLPRVATEMALHVLAYNLTRVINIMGVQPLLAAMTT